MTRQHDPQSTASPVHPEPVEGPDPALLVGLIQLIIAERLALPSQIEPHSLLRADLGWTDVTLGKASIAIENRWQIRFTDAEVECWCTVADIARSIGARI